MWYLLLMIISLMMALIGFLIGMYGEYNWSKGGYCCAAIFFIIFMMYYWFI